MRPLTLVPLSAGADPLPTRFIRQYCETMLMPYWIECVDAPGVGITAQSEADALILLEEAFGGGRRARHVSRVHDITELDQNHVVPNMGNWLKRGVWYPLGHEHVARF
jgi:hypothetical protein